METKRQIITIEKGEILDELSLDMILGGAVDPTTPGGEGAETGSDCDYCNTCDQANNSHNDDRIVGSL